MAASTFIPPKSKTNYSRILPSLKSAVVGVPDEKWGEVPVAFVALKSTARITEPELIDFLRSRINKIKLPRQVIFLEALPRNAYGKVQKLDLRNRLRPFQPNISGRTF